MMRKFSNKLHVYFLVSVYCITLIIFIALIRNDHVVLQLDADNFEKEGKLAEIREQRGYNYSDCITVTPEKLPNYEQKVCDQSLKHIISFVEYINCHRANSLV